MIEDDPQKNELPPEVIDRLQKISPMLPEVRQYISGNGKAIILSLMRHDPATLIAMAKAYHTATGSKILISDIEQHIDHSLDCIASMEEYTKKYADSSKREYIMSSVFHDTFDGIEWKNTSMASVIMAIIFCDEKTSDKIKILKKMGHTYITLSGSRIGLTQVCHFLNKQEEFFEIYKELPKVLSFYNNLEHPLLKMAMRDESVRNKIKAMGQTYLSVTNRKLEPDVAEKYLERYESFILACQHFPSQNIEKEIELVEQVKTLEGQYQTLSTSDLLTTLKAGEDIAHITDEAELKPLLRIWAHTPAIPKWLAKEISSAGDWELMVAGQIANQFALRFFRNQLPEGVLHDTNNGLLFIDSSSDAVRQWKDNSELRDLFRKKYDEMVAQPRQKLIAEGFFDDVPKNRELILTKILHGRSGLTKEETETLVRDIPIKSLATIKIAPWRLVMANIAKDKGQSNIKELGQWASLASLATTNIFGKGSEEWLERASGIMPPVAKNSNKDNVIVLKDDSGKEHQLTFSFKKMNREKFQVTVRGKTPDEVDNGRKDALIARGEINLNGKIGPELSQIPIKWSNGSTSTLNIYDHFNAPQKKSVHDAIYWLPADKSSKELEGLDKWLRQFSTCDVAGLQMVAQNWPILSADDRKMSYNDLLKTLQKRQYKNINSEAFALESSHWGVNPKNYSSFERLYMQGQKIPEAFDSSQRWVVGDLTARFLPRNDVRVGFFGLYTDCCQHLMHSSGRSCAESCMIDPFSQLFVIEDKGGNIISGSWAWKSEIKENNEKNPEKSELFSTVTFDNNESLKGQKHREEEIAMLYDQAAAYLIKQGVRKVTLGIDSSDIAIPERWKAIEPLPLPKKYRGNYTDAKTQVLLAENADATSLKNESSKMWFRPASPSDWIEADKIAALVYPEGWQTADRPSGNDPRGIVVEHEKKGIVGYVTWSEEEHYICDIAAKPDEPVAGAMLMKAMLEHTRRSGGIWQVDARTSSSLRFLEKAAERGEIAMKNLGDSGFDLGGEKMHKIVFMFI